MGRGELSWFFKHVCCYTSCICACIDQHQQECAQLTVNIGELTESLEAAKEEINCLNKTHLTELEDLANSHQKELKASISARTSDLKVVTIKHREEVTSLKKEIEEAEEK